MSLLIQKLYNLEQLNYADNNAMGSTKKSRKRTRNPEKHKAQEKKQKVQKGEERTTSTGKTIQKKYFAHK